ncbi:glycosyltransferase [Lysinibacillus sp. SGAir0095]|uniref:glycosyltransferase n=1 Tax=Lysinibacillus sp. SGAir0095 TaxID=2070463 RepID=UPI00143D76D7|nr:glycosyltransferase [Lysinibacillus sp. SGAir0095]
MIPFLAKRFPDIQFIMVQGNRPQYQHLWLEESPKNLKMYYQVPHHELAELMRSWHVLICGSKWETGATYVKEAMASGVPVIAPKVAALSEVASSQILLEDLKWEKSTKEPKVLMWSEESKERFGLALDELLRDRRGYKKLVSNSLEESKKSSPENIAKLWFDFMYKCRDLKDV